MHAPEDLSVDSAIYNFTRGLISTHAHVFFVAPCLEKRRELSAVVFPSQLLKSQTAGAANIFRRACLAVPGFSFFSDPPSSARTSPFLQTSCCVVCTCIVLLYFFVCFFLSLFCCRVALRSCVLCNDWRILCWN